MYLRTDAYNRGQQMLPIAVKFIENNDFVRLIRTDGELISENFTIRLYVNVP